MKLLEFEAKNILRTAGVPLPDSYLASNKPEFLPAVLKSQVPTGGRGKSGGIRIVKTKDEYHTTLAKLLKHPIKGLLPQSVLAEQLLDIQRELYLSLTIDHTAASIVLMAHTNGGVEVEDNAASDFLRLVLTTENANQVGLQLSEYYDTPAVEFALQDLVQNLLKIFNQQDMTLLEINPLIITTGGDLVAGDAKITLDDAAVFRHANWKFQETHSDNNFVTLNPHGTIATIANGAGLAMATVDAVADAGMLPANFLDIGGGASESSVLAAFQRIMEYQSVRVIVINIFAGITRCDEVARAIIAARTHIDNLPPLVIRLAGTNYEQAADLLQSEHITLQPNLPAAIATARGIVG